MYRYHGNSDWKTWVLRSALLIFSPLLSFCSSCAHQPAEKQAVLNAEATPGKLRLDILQPGEPEFYWQYEIEPARGAVHLFSQQTFANYKEERLAEGHLRSGSFALCKDVKSGISPDGRYSASCQLKGNAEEFLIVDVKTGATIYKWDTASVIRGFAWSPNARSIAICNMSGRFGVSPLELLAFFGGHGVQHNAVYLDVVDMGSLSRTHYEIRRNVLDAWPRILDWN
jgi:hypothetical protein